MTLEQQARDMLERMGVENAQSFSAGDVGELANLIAQKDKQKSDILTELKQKLSNSNSNFHFKNLDWNVRIALSELCVIIDRRLKNIFKD